MYRKSILLAADKYGNDLVTVTCGIGNLSNLFLFFRNKRLEEDKWEEDKVKKATVSCILKGLVDISCQRQSLNHLNATNSPNFLKSDFSFPLNSLS